MKTGEFLSTLRAHSDRPLFLSLGRGRHVSAGYHLTEVKRVAFETMDCGAMAHSWRETHFELWATPLPEIRPAYMAAGKFLSIVGRVEEKLPLDGETEAKFILATAIPLPRCMRSTPSRSSMTGSKCGSRRTRPSAKPPRVD